MERLFSPCTRLRNVLERELILISRVPREELQELQELNLDVSTEQFLSAERVFTYADLYAMLANEYTVLWLTPYAAVVPAIYGKGVCSWGELEESCHVCFSADGKEMVALARSPDHLLEISDVVVRLLAASVVHSAHIMQWDSRSGLLINAPTLEYLMEKCQVLRVLTLNKIQMDANHCRVLGEYSRPGLDIELTRCKFTNAGSSALAEVLGRNQGPTKLDECSMDNSVLANGLRGNSRLKNFKPIISVNVEVVGHQGLLAIAGALKENKGLVDLNLRCCSLTSETWGAVCNSLKTHPTLQTLEFRPMWTFGRSRCTPAILKLRIQALVDMVKVNMSIHTIHLHDQYSKHELFRGSVIPYLETNMFRLRVRAIQKTIPFAYRAKVLGRALLAVRSDPNRFWMLLSGNAEVAFPSTTATTTLATNLPTPATVDVPVTATRDPSTTAASADPRTACQKRKTRP
jgi:hypothetical protein